MSLLIIIALPMLCAFGLLYWGYCVKEKYPIMTEMFHLAFIPLTWLSINFAIISARLDYTADAELVELLGDFAYYLGWLFFIVGLIVLYKVLTDILAMIQQKKAEKEEEKYG